MGHQWQYQGCSSTLLMIAATAYLGLLWGLERITPHQSTMEGPGYESIKETHPSNGTTTTEVLVQAVYGTNITGAPIY